MKVLITGVTGSLGSALLRYLLANNLAERIVGYSRDEVKQAQLAAEVGDPQPLRWVLGDVRDPDRLRRALWGCDTVIHCAALKRVDRIAHDPNEAILTNVLGSKNVVDCAIDCGIQRVLLISSDKAVEPTNFYGCTKSAMEGYGIAANVYGMPRGTQIAVARWGNVLGSRGSVLHAWRAAAANGSPLPMTDYTCTRFWMVLPQAVKFVLSCLQDMQGGELYTPKLGASPIAALALALVGDEGAKVELSSLRPGGEKLHEKLISDEEISRTHDIGWAYLIRPHIAFWRRVEWPGEPVPPAFRYASDEETLQMSMTELKALLELA